VSSQAPGAGGGLPTHSPGRFADDVGPTRFAGTVISPGVAFGFARVIEPLAFPDAPATIAADDVDLELARLRHARTLVREHLDEHVRGVHAPAGEDAAQIFAAHLLVLDDQGFFASIAERIRDRRMSADRAVRDAFGAAAERLAGSEDCYLRSRAEDLRDICASVRRALAYGAGAFALPDPRPGPTVLVVPALRPSVVLRARREGVVAMVADDAALMSHGAILLRTAGIPALGGIRLEDTPVRDGTPLLVNGADGTLTVMPTEQEAAAARALMRETPSPAEDAARLPPLDAVLPDGDVVALYANIDDPAQAGLCLRHRLRGVGLFRTEFLAADHRTVPDEEQQYRTMRELLETLRGRPLVVRTFDFGADKDPAELHHCFGPNPALGLRGIRRHLQRVPEELRTQFRAILRAAVDAPISILLPMVTTAADVRAARELLAQAAEDLARRGVPHSADVKVGAMLEVPSAALQVTALLDVVDFLSVGTNDLVQYLTAADRENPAVLHYHAADGTGLYSLLAFVMETARAAHRERDLSVCGELASDPTAAAELVKLGFRSLSVTPQAADLVRASLGRPRLSTAARRRAQGAP
jgi:phosphoenolpyruvate-protein phosphotransferase (PTS system enzyme I)